MQVITIGIDLAKNVFQAHGVDANDKVVFNKPLRRSEVLPFFAKLPPCLIGMSRHSCVFCGIRLPIPKRVSPHAGFWCTLAMKHLVGIRLAALRPDHLWQATLAAGGKPYERGVYEGPAVALASPTPLKALGPSDSVLTLLKAKLRFGRQRSELLKRLRARIRALRNKDANRWSWTTLLLCLSGLSKAKGMLRPSQNRETGPACCSHLGPAQIPIGALVRPCAARPKFSGRDDQ
jgi:hypothetical protein